VITTGGQASMIWSVCLFRQSAGSNPVAFVFGCFLRRSALIPDSSFATHRSVRRKLLAIGDATMAGNSRWMALIPPQKRLALYDEKLPTYLGLSGVFFLETCCTFTALTCAGGLTTLKCSVLHNQIPCQRLLGFSYGTQ